MSTLENIDNKINQMARLGSDHWRKHFDEEYTDLLKLLIGSLLANEEEDIDIGIANNEFAILSYDQYEDAFYLHLICKGKSKFEIEWWCEDYEAGGLETYTKMIDNLELIPSGLLKLMEEVTRTGEGKVVNVRQLKQS